MNNTWLVLIPPFIVLVLALVFRRLISAMITGLIVAALIAADFAPIPTITLLGKRLWMGISDLETFYNFSFLFAIGVLVSLLTETGGSAAFASSLANRLRSPRMVEGAVIPFSCILALDDYLNTLTVAHIMRPLTAKFNIPRAKLAFLVQALAGPLVILIPLSSWAALIIGQLDASGISTNQHAKVFADPFFVYLKSIPFIFYSLLVIISVWFIIRFRISYGPMHKHEIIAQETGNLVAGKIPLNEIDDKQVHEIGDLWDLILPFATLLISVLIGIAWSGGYWMFGGSGSFIDALKNNNQTALVLFTSSILTLIVGFVQAVLKRRISLSHIPRIIISGILLMYSAILVVFLASILGSILRHDLETGAYLAHKLLGSIPLSLLPLMLFITTSLISLAIGTAWGSITLMLPIAIPMFLTFAGVTTPTTLPEIPLLLPILGAVFSGAVVGDHLSPVSGAAIMAANSSGCYPLDHTITQIPYAIPAIVGSCVAFFAATYFSYFSPIACASIAFAIGIIPCFILLYLLNKKK